MSRFGGAFMRSLAVANLYENHANLPRSDAAMRRGTDIADLFLRRLLGCFTRGSLRPLIRAGRLCYEVV
jgi:hypothetical protein